MAEKKGKILPNDLEVEQCLLGCIFKSLDAGVDIFPQIAVQDFYSNAHKKIYQAMLDNYIKNVAVDYVTVAKVLDSKGELEEVGGMGYIVDLADFVPSSANYKDYMQIIKNDSILRQIIEASQATINDAFESSDAGSVLAKAEKLIFDISQTKSRSSLEHIKFGVNDAIDLMEKLAIDPNANAGVKTGFPTLDKITNGFKSGELIIIAARPGIGKTTLAVNFAINAAVKYGKSVAMFDLEMSSLQVAQRFICATGRVPMDSVKGGTKDQNTWATLFETKKILENANIYIDDTTTITPAEILSKCRRLKAQNGLDMVIIDYLQLMKAEKQSKDGNRQQEVADLTRSIKLAARELGCPIILLSQLNRGVEQRSDKTPQLSDLRESGSIEQDADIVMFISDRKDESVKEEESDDDAIDYTLVIAKHRNGMRGNIPIKWKPDYTQFYEPGKDILYTKNTSKVQKNTVLTAVSDSDIDDVFKD
ncbi:MAG: replicative DNA helicase [Clostridia bacterium]|nr:replicative DNA helicase [Clostridia bacterium]